jgi:1-deoxy-D-xylulose-5-phosphate synthase
VRLILRPSNIAADRLAPVILPSIETPADLQSLSYHQLQKLSEEIRDFIISNVTRTGGHLGSNLGVVELTIA